MEKKFNKVELKCLETFYKILRSSSFNVIMLLIGFLVGVLSVSVHYKYVSVRNQNNEFILRIEEKMDEFDKLDDEYEVLQREIRDLMKEARVKLVKDLEKSE